MRDRNTSRQNESEGLDRVSYLTYDPDREIDVDANGETMLKEITGMIETVNSIALTGDFGIITAVGPFDYHSEHLQWEVAIPLDEDAPGYPGDGAIMALEQQVEAYAVCIVDGEPHLGGKVIDYYEVDDELLIAVDQYPMGTVEE